MMIVSSLVSAFEDLGNPFLDESEDLFALHTLNICSSHLTQIKSIGVQQFNTFVKERLNDCTVPITAQIARNKLCLFKQSVSRVKPMLESKLVATRND